MTTWAAGHSPSHLERLPDLRRPAEPGLCDAVVVPTSRDPRSTPTRGIEHAARLAAAHGAPLLIVVSRDAAVPEARARIVHRVQAATGRALAPEIVLLDDVRPVVTLRTRSCLLPHLAARLAVGAVAPVAPSDVPEKRNAAIEIAARRGWRTVLFLDDDIRPWARRGDGETKPHPVSRTLDAEGLQAAVGALGERVHRAVGWAAEDHPDNSVLCRLRRRAGFAQGVFIGGGALLVGVDAATPFFPSIYNEDWLFVIGLLRSGKDPVACGGRVLQDTPQESPTPGRAVYEEFGDVLAETLLNLAVVPGPVFESAADPSFWRDALSRRAAMIHRVSARVLDHQDEASAAEANWALPVLDVLRNLHEGLPADDVATAFCDYVSAWRADLRTWRRHLVAQGAPATAPRARVLAAV